MLLTPKVVTCMEQITISKFIFDSLVESVEDLKQVLNRVNYDTDHTDPQHRILSSIRCRVFKIINRLYSFRPQNYQGDQLMNATMESIIETMGKTYFDRFMIYVEQEDLDTSKAIMEEWIVDGQDPEDGGVEFIWLDKDDSV